MLTNDNIATLKNAASILRGQVLEGCVTLEWFIDSYISNHFISQEDQTKLEELVTLVLAPRVSFENKCQIFSVLVNKYHPNFKEKNSSYLADLRKIGEHRNVFAHYPLCVGEDTYNDWVVNKNISLLKFKNTTIKDTKEVRLSNVVVYLDADTQSLLDFIYRYTEEVRFLLPVGS